jgi:hypothetical protein
MVLHSQAGDALLETYNAERQPVGRQIVDRANKSVTDMLGWFAAVGELRRVMLDAAAQVWAKTGVPITSVRVSLGLDVNDVYGHWMSRPAEYVRRCKDNDTGARLMRIGLISMVRVSC